jgi:hypothetical protein
MFLCRTCWREDNAAWAAAACAKDDDARDLMRAALERGVLAKSEEIWLCDAGWTWVRNGDFERRLEAYRAKSSGGRASKKNVDRGAGFEGKR